MKFVKHKIIILDKDMKPIQSFFIIPLLLMPICLKSQNNITEYSPGLSLNNSNIRHSGINYLQIPSDEIIKAFDNQPSFGMYKDNYFITGIPTNKKIGRTTADAKFQISIRQRLLNIDLPFNSHIFIIYSQKSFWDVYESSSPFADNNYNPGLLWTTPIILDNSLRGMASFSLEHESNGKGGEDSRCWNYFSLSGSYFINNSLSAQVKLWYGFGLNEDNPNLLKYKGYGLVALNYRTTKDKFRGSLIINPCKGFRAFNTTLEVNFKISTKLNQYFFIQWYNGYAESLLEYDKYCSMVRAGICLKPLFTNLY